MRALEATVCFRIAADDFMTMVSDNVLLAQSLFGLLLANDGPRVPFRAAPSGVDMTVRPQAPRLRPACCVRIRCCREHRRRSCWR